MAEYAIFSLVCMLVQHVGDAEEKGRKSVGAGVRYRYI